MTTSQIVTAVISILSLLGVGTILAQFWKDRHDQRKEKTAEAKRKQKEEKQAELREVIQEEMNPLKERLAAVEEQLKKSQDGVCAGLRNHLLNFYYNCAKKGYRTLDDSENFREMYNSYIALGGNSFIQRDVRKWFENIPSEDNYHEKENN